MLTQSLHVIRSRLLKGSGAQAFGQLVQIFVRLAEVPLLLSFWGTQLYGEWLMLAAIPAYLSIGDGGFSTAACREIAMKSSAGDRQGALTVFQSTWLLLLICSLIALLTAYCFSELAPIVKWLKFSTMNSCNLQAVMILLVINVLVSFQGSLLMGGFWATGRYPIGMFLSTVSQLFEFLGMGLAIILGGGPVQAAIGYLSGRIVGTFLMWVGHCKVSSWLQHGFSSASLSEIRRLTPLAFSSLAFPVGNALNVQGMRLVVGLTLGPAAVAIFTPLRTLSRLAMQPKQIVNLLLEPELSLAHGKSNKMLFQHLFLKSCQITAWGSISASVFVMLGADLVLPYWTAGKIEMHWPLFATFLLTVPINGVWHPALKVPLSTNRHQKIAITFILTYGLLPLYMAYFLSGVIGLIGPGLALIIAESTTAFSIVKEAIRLSQTSFLHWLKAVHHPPFDLISNTWAMHRKNAQ